VGLESVKFGEAEVRLPVVEPEVPLGEELLRRPSAGLQEPLKSFSFSVHGSAFERGC
jgi:hypothetical protein